MIDDETGIHGGNPAADDDSNIAGQDERLETDAEATGQPDASAAENDGSFANDGSIASDHQSANAAVVHSPDQASAFAAPPDLASPGPGSSGPASAGPASSGSAIPPREPSTPSYIVGIGASAGGLEAIEAFFDNMPADTGMAFVVVQHLSPDFKSLMAELLARHTKMAIHPVTDGMRVEANQVYLIPARKNMVLRDGKLLLTEQDVDRGINLPIDIFFHSLANDAPNRAIAVILSGTGSDGSRGLQHVHESGGLVIGQSAATAGFDGMPKSARATGMVDVVTSPSAMPGRIMQFVEGPSTFKRGVEDDDPPVSDEGEMGLLFRLFRRRFGIDFSRYRATTINRRIDRRIQMTGSGTLANYLSKLDSEPLEMDVLYRDLLVEVTQFFRDSAAFERIRNDVIPDLLEECPPDGQLRFWVPACATGEEAYSLAMIAREC